MGQASMVVAALAALFLGDDPKTILTGSEKTAHFLIHFRPGSRAESSVDRVAFEAERNLTMILGELDLKQFADVIHLYLYDDVEELQKISGQPVGGYSIPLESHIPHDNDQTRIHEMVHVVAERFTEHGNEPRNLFFAEGLANAVLRYVHGLPVDAVAAFYMQANQLPSIVEVAALPDFYEWLREHPGVNGYDIAGSFMRHLLDTYGAAKVRKFYKGVPAKECFGENLETIDKAWRAKLAKIKLRPGTEMLLKLRAAAGKAGAKDPETTDLPRITPEILGADSLWKSLSGAKFHAGDPGEWNGDTLRISGVKSDGDWSCVRFDAPSTGNAMFRCRIETKGAFGVLLQIGPRCKVMSLRGQGCFFYDDTQARASSDRVKLKRAEADLVVRRVGDTATLWIDGVLALEAKMPRDVGPLGIGCVGGKAEATAISWRPLEEK